MKLLLSYPTKLGDTIVEIRKHVVISENKYGIVVPASMAKEIQAVGCFAMSMTNTPSVERVECETIDCTRAKSDKWLECEVINALEEDDSVLIVGRVLRAKA